MLYNILKQCSPAELEAMDDQEIPDDVKAKMVAEGVVGTDDGGAEASGDKNKRKLQLRNKI
jgi:hypothetical protein